MEIETFLLERNQSRYENEVEINLTESGIHALSLREILAPEEIEQLLKLSLGYGHTEGTPALRAAIASWHPTATADNVLVTTGASEANLVALLSAIRAGDELVVVLPNFMQIPGAARAFGANVKTVTLSEDAGWHVNEAQLDAAATGRTRMIALCNPNNPTGILLNEADRRTLLRASEKSGAWLLIDEIYRGAEIAGPPETPTFWGANPNIIITGGLAKSFAQPGLRIGWIVGPPDFIEECMRRQDYTTIGSNVVGQFVAERVLEANRRESIFMRNRRILRRNLQILQEWVEQQGGTVALTSPQAGGMAFLSYAHDVNSTQLSDALRQQQSVFVVAGDWFGLDGRIRIGIGGEEIALREGLRRLALGLEAQARR